MKVRSIIYSLLFFVSVGVSAQTMKGSFKITNNNHPENESFYIASIEKANLESYRLQNKEVTVHFENGFDCVLKSAKALFLEGKNINATSYQESFSEIFSLPVFNIVNSGALVAIYPVKNKKYK